MNFLTTHLVTNLVTVKLWKGERGRENRKFEIYKRKGFDDIKTKSIGTRSLWSHNADSRPLSILLLFCTSILDLIQISHVHHHHQISHDRKVQTRKSANMHAKDTLRGFLFPNAITNIHYFRVPGVLIFKAYGHSWNKPVVKPFHWPDSKWQMSYIPPWWFPDP